MDTGLKYEGEQARQRFIVYWLRPAIAALGFGMFTFLVVSMPAEKEKIQLRGEVQQLRSENEHLEGRLRYMLPFANAGQTTELTVATLGVPGDDAAWGRVLYDQEVGRGVIFVKNLVAEGQRGFGWWIDPDGKRFPLAAIDLIDGAGQASIQLGQGRLGSFVVTLESLEGDPSDSSPPILEAAID
jgi:hypothetical protein